MVELRGSGGEYSPEECGEQKFPENKIFYGRLRFLKFLEEPSEKRLTKQYFNKNKQILMCPVSKYNLIKVVFFFVLNQKQVTQILKIEN